VSAVRVSTWRLEQIRLNGSALRGKQRASFLLFVCPFVLQRQRAGEAFFVEDVGGKGAFAALERADFFLDALLYEQPVGEN